MNELKRAMMAKLLNNQREILMSVILAFVVLMLSGCKPIVKTLGPFISNNASESKRIGVFLWEYYPVKTIKFDTIHLKINEVFAEKQYGYKGYNDLSYAVDDSVIQIVINTNNNLVKLKYREQWTLEDFYWKGDSSLVRVFEKITPPDILSVNVLRVDINKDGGAGTEDGKVIGTFILRRKPSNVSNLAIPK
jgi:hypothetical protein